MTDTNLRSSGAHETARTRKRANALAAIVMMMLAGGTVVAIPVASADNTCEDDNSGYGWEPVSCSGVSCLEGEFFYVQIEASNQNDYVEAEGECGTADFQCSATDGRCQGWSTAPTATGSHGGECSGKAYVGNAGSVDLYCESGSSETDLQEAIRQALRQGLDVCPAIAPVGHASSVLMLSWEDDRVHRIIMTNGVCHEEQQDLSATNGWVTLRS